MEPPWGEMVPMRYMGLPCIFQTFTGEEMDILQNFTDRLANLMPGFGMLTDSLGVTGQQNEPQKPEPADIQ